jgi:hypothetical protein
MDFPVWPRAAPITIPEGQFQKCFKQWYHLHIKGRATQSDSKRQDFPSTALAHTRRSRLKNPWSAHSLSSLLAGPVRLLTAEPQGSGMVLGMGWGSSINIYCWILKNCRIILVTLRHLHIDYGYIFSWAQWPSASIQALGDQSGHDWPAQFTILPYSWQLLHSVLRGVSTRHLRCQHMASV